MATRDEPLDSFPPQELYLEEPSLAETSDILTEPLGKVLIVDDSQAFVKQLARVIEGPQAIVETASSGEEAIERATRSAFAMILLDVGLPGLDGFATAERLRSMPEHASTPIVFMTGTMRDSSTAFRGYELGAVDFLFKPIDPVVLKSKSRVFIELFDQRRKLEAVVSELGNPDELSHLVEDLEVERRRRKALAERLWRSERRLRAVVQNNADGLLVTDPRGTILFLNGSAARMLGRDARDAVGLLFFLPDDGQLLELQIGEEIRKIEVRLSQVEWSLGERAVLAALRDVTERERFAHERRVMEAQLLEANKLEAIGQLAAGIAHEINTPTQYIGSNLEFIDRAGQKISQVTSALQMASRAGFSSEAVEKLRAELRTAKLDFLATEVPRAIKEARDGLEQVASIVRSMKEFSHPGSGSKEPTDLKRIVESAVVVSRNEWKYVADVNTSFAPDLPEVECIGVEIRQVVLNLVVNAAHAIAGRIEGDKSARGKIEIALLVEGEYVEIHVRDDGTGIPRDILPRIFDPFFTTKPVGKGTGQGLAIVYAVVVRRHAGYLRAASDPGVGTDLVVALPINGTPPTPSPLAMSFTDLHGQPVRSTHSVGEFLG